MHRSFSLCVMLFFSAITQFCSPQSSTEIQEFPGRYFDHVATYPIPDSLFLTDMAPMDVAVDSSGDFYMIDFFGRRLVKTEPPFQSVQQIGGEGIGPGEYIRPKAIYLFEGSLYYTDSRNTLMKSIPLTESEKENYKNEPIPSRGSFAISNSFIVTQNHHAPYFRLYSNTPEKSWNPNLLFETFTPEALHSFNNEVRPGEIFIDIRGLIYYLPASPLKILVYQHQESQTMQVREYNLEGLPGVVPWTSKIENKFQSMPSEQKLVYYSTSFSVPNQLFYLTGSTDAIFVTLVNPEEQYVVYLLSFQDELMAAYQLKNLYPIAVQEDAVYFYKNPDEEEPAMIECYEYTG